jgi:hypothetical protein
VFVKLEIATPYFNIKNRSFVDKSEKVRKQGERNKKNSISLSLFLVAL